MKKLLLAALILGGAATPAMAQDAGSWTGAYVGGRVGYAFQPNNGDETILFDRNLDGTFGDTISTAAAPTGNAFSPGFCGGATTASTPGSCSSDKDGIDLAVHLGYDYQFDGGFVLGIVADYGTQDGRDSVTAFSTTPAFYTITRKLKDNYSIRARAGIGMENVLVYATGGMAWGKVKNSFATSNTVNSFTGSGNDTASGYRLGAGAEYRLGTNITLGVQYLYTSLDDDDFRLRVANNGTTAATNPFLLGNAAGTDFRRSEDKLTSSSLAATINFRF